MSKSKRLKAQPIPSVDEFYQTVNLIASLQSDAAVLIARRDRAIQRINAAYAAKIQPFTDQIGAKLALADAFAQEHRNELLPKDRKSVDLAQATFGFRTATRSVKLLSKTSEEQAIALLEDADLGEYVREVKEIDRAKILADCDDDKTLLTLAFADDVTGVIKIPATEVPLSTVGLKIAQPETFYIEPKVASGETLKPVEAAA